MPCTMACQYVSQVWLWWTLANMSTYSIFLEVYTRICSALMYSVRISFLTKSLDSCIQIRQAFSCVTRTLIWLPQYRRIERQSWWCDQMKIFLYVTSPLCGESVNHQWISITKISDADIWLFYLTCLKQTVEQTIETPVIWDVIALIMTLL